MRYLRRTLNYPERVSLYDLTHMMSTIDLETIGVEAPRIDNVCSLEKYLTELIHMNP